QGELEGTALLLCSGTASQLPGDTKTKGRQRQTKQGKILIEGKVNASQRGCGANEGLGRGLQNLSVDEDHKPHLPPASQHGDDLPLASSPSTPSPDQDTTSEIAQREEKACEQGSPQGGTFQKESRNAISSDRNLSSSLKTPSSSACSAPSSCPTENASHSSSSSASFSSSSFPQMMTFCGAGGGGHVGRGGDGVDAATGLRCKGTGGRSYDLTLNAFPIRTDLQRQALEGEPTHALSSDTSRGGFRRQNTTGSLFHEMKRNNPHRMDKRGLPDSSSNPLLLPSEEDSEEKHDEQTTPSIAADRRRTTTPSLDAERTFNSLHRQEDTAHSPAGPSAFFRDSEGEKLGRDHVALQSSYDLPTTSASGGGGYSRRAGQGGGLIWIEAFMIEIYGVVEANGGHAEAMEDVPVEDSIRRALLLEEEEEELQAQQEDQGEAKKEKEIEIEKQEKLPKKGEDSIQMRGRKRRKEDEEEGLREKKVILHGYERMARETEAMMNNDQEIEGEVLSVREVEGLQENTKCHIGCREVSRGPLLSREKEFPHFNPSQNTVRVSFSFHPSVSFPLSSPTVSSLYPSLSNTSTAKERRKAREVFSFFLKQERREKEEVQGQKHPWFFSSHLHRHKEGEEEEEKLYEGKKKGSSGAAASFYLATAMADLSQAGQGGGAGGSIVLRAFSLKGRGRLSARGGKGGRCTGGGGGGGVVGFLWIGEKREAEKGLSSQKERKRKKKTGGIGRLEGERKGSRQGILPTEKRVENEEADEEHKDDLNDDKEMKERGDKPSQETKAKGSFREDYAEGKADEGIQEGRDDRLTSTTIRPRPQDSLISMKDLPGHRQGVSSRDKDVKEEEKADIPITPPSGSPKCKKDEKKVFLSSPSSSTIFSSPPPYPPSAYLTSSISIQMPYSREDEEDEGSDEEEEEKERWKSISPVRFAASFTGVIDVSGGSSDTSLVCQQLRLPLGEKGYQGQVVPLPSLSSSSSCPPGLAGWDCLPCPIGFYNLSGESFCRPCTNKPMGSSAVYTAEKKTTSKIHHDASSFFLNWRYTPSQTPDGECSYECTTGFPHAHLNPLCLAPFPFLLHYLSQSFVFFLILLLLMGLFITGLAKLSQRIRWERPSTSLHMPMRSPPRLLSLQQQQPQQTNKLKTGNHLPHLYRTSSNSSFFSSSSSPLPLHPSAQKTLGRPSSTPTATTAFICTSTPTHTSPMSDLDTSPQEPNRHLGGEAFPSSSSVLPSDPSKGLGGGRGRRAGRVISPSEGSSSYHLHSDRDEMKRGRKLSNPHSQTIGRKAPHASGNDFDSSFPLSGSSLVSSGAGAGPGGGGNYRRSRAVQERRSVRMSRTSLTMEDLPYHVQRVALFGSNRPTDPWGLDASPSSFLLPLIIPSRYAAFASQVNSICSYPRWFACLYDLLKFTYLPLAEIVLRIAQRRRAEALLSFVLSLDTRRDPGESSSSSSSSLVFWRSIRARELSFGIKLTISASLDTCYLDILDFDRNPLDYHVYPHVPMIILPSDTDSSPSYTSHIDKRHPSSLYPLTTSPPTTTFSYYPYPSAACLSEPSSLACRSFSSPRLGGHGETSSSLDSFNRSTAVQEGNEAVSAGISSRGLSRLRVSSPDFEETYGFFHGRSQETQSPYDLRHLSPSTQQQKEEERRYWRSVGEIEENNARGGRSPFTGVLEQVIGTREARVLFEFFKRKASVIHQPDLLEAIHIDQAMALFTPSSRHRRGEQRGRRSVEEEEEEEQLKTSSSRYSSSSYRLHPSASACHNDGSLSMIEKNLAYFKNTEESSHLKRRGICACCGGLLLVSPLAHRQEHLPLWNWVRASLSSFSSSIKSPCLFRRSRLPPQRGNALLRGARANSLNRHTSIVQHDPTSSHNRWGMYDTNDGEDFSTLCWRPSQGAADVFGLCEGVRRLSNELLLPHGLRAHVCIFPIDGFINESGESIQRLGILTRQGPSSTSSPVDPSIYSKGGRGEAYRRDESLAQRAYVSSSLSPGSARLGVPSLSRRWISDSRLEAFRDRRLVVQGEGAWKDNIGLGEWARRSSHRKGDICHSVLEKDIMRDKTMGREFSTSSSRRKTPSTFSLRDLQTSSSLPPNASSLMRAMRCEDVEKKSHVVSFKEESSTLHSLSSHLGLSRGDERNYSAFATDPLSDTFGRDGDSSESPVMITQEGSPGALFSFPRLVTPPSSNLFSSGASSSESYGPSSPKEPRSASTSSGLSRRLMEIFSFSSRKLNAPFSSPSQKVQSILLTTSKEKATLKRNLDILSRTSHHLKQIDGAAFVPSNNGVGVSTRAPLVTSSASQWVSRGENPQADSSLRHLAGPSLLLAGDVRGGLASSEGLLGDPHVFGGPPSLGSSSSVHPTAYGHVEVAFRANHILHPSCDPVKPSGFVCLAKDVKSLKTSSGNGQQGGELKVRHLRQYTLALVVTESLSEGLSPYGYEPSVDEVEDDFSCRGEGESNHVVRLPTLCAPLSGNALTSPLDPRRLHPVNFQATPYVSPSIQRSSSGNHPPVVSSRPPLLSPKPSLGSEVNYNSSSSTNKSPTSERMAEAGEPWNSQVREISPTGSNESILNRLKPDENEHATRHELLATTNEEAGLDSQVVSRERPREEEMSAYESPSPGLSMIPLGRSITSASGVSLGSEESSSISMKHDTSPLLVEERGRRRRPTPERNKLHLLSCRRACSYQSPAFPQPGETTGVHHGDTDHEFVNIPTPPAYSIGEARGLLSCDNEPDTLFDFPEFSTDPECSGRCQGDFEESPGFESRQGSLPDRKSVMIPSDHAGVQPHQDMPSMKMGSPAFFNSSRTSHNTSCAPQTSRTGHDRTKGKLFHTYERLPARSTVGTGSSTAVAAAAIGELSRRLLQGLAGRDNPSPLGKETDSHVSQGFERHRKYQGSFWRVHDLYNRASYGAHRGESSGWADYLGVALGAAKKRVAPGIDPLGCSQEQQSPDGSLAFIWASPSLPGHGSGKGGLCGYLRWLTERIQGFFLKRRRHASTHGWGSMAFGIALAVFLLHTLCVSVQYFIMYYAAAPSVSEMPFPPRNPRLPPLLGSSVPIVFPAPLDAPLQFPLRSTADTLAFPVSLHLYMALLCPPLADLFTLVTGLIFLISADPDKGKLFVMSIPASLPRHVVGLGLRLWEQPQFPLVAWSVFECIAFVILKVFLASAANVYLGYTEKGRRSGRNRTAGSDDVDPFVEEVEETSRFCVCARPRLREERLL
ncbi:transmembrane protein, partial [Cystoisospora suis]